MPWVSGTVEGDIDALGRGEFIAKTEDLMVYQSELAFNSLHV